MSTKKIINIVLVVLAALITVAKAIGDMDLPPECDETEE